MGWAGPAQITGPDSAPKGLADLGPTKSPIFFWARPGPDSKDGPESVWPINTWLGQNQPGPEKEKTNNAGPESAWPSNITDGGRGNYFPSLLPACRTLFILHAGEKKHSKTPTMKGKKSYLAQRRRCVAGLAASLAVEAGGGVVAHGRRLQTVILLFPAAEREILPLPLSSIFFRSFFLCFVYQWLSLCPLGFVF